MKVKGFKQASSSARRTGRRMPCQRAVCSTHTVTHTHGVRNEQKKIHSLFFLFHYGPYSFQKNILFEATASDPATETVIIKISELKGCRELLHFFLLAVVIVICLLNILWLPLL